MGAAGPSTREVEHIDIWRNLVRTFFQESDATLPSGLACLLGNLQLIHELSFLGLQLVFLPDQLISFGNQGLVVVSELRDLGPQSAALRDGRVARTLELSGFRAELRHLVGQEVRSLLLHILLLQALREIDVAAVRSGKLFLLRRNLLLQLLLVRAQHIALVGHDHELLREVRNGGLELQTLLLLLNRTRLRCRLRLLGGRAIGLPPLHGGAQALVVRARVEQGALRRRSSGL
mmetsp:Transcript_78678/g.200267  ORF Transcript_78678/g.200267 Transcript_78678/m.200267 type:complete len:233 (-) Transcript_78678:429-1127(-)